MKPTLARRLRNWLIALLSVAAYVLLVVLFSRCPYKYQIGCFSIPLCLFIMIASLCLTGSRNEKVAGIAGDIAFGFRFLMLLFVPFWLVSGCL